jgi:hypothetical protein
MNKLKWIICTLVIAISLGLLSTGNSAGEGMGYSPIPSPSGPDDRQGPAPPATRRVPAYLPIDSNLYYIALDFETATLPPHELQLVMRKRGVDLDSSGRVLVEAIGPVGGEGLPSEQITQLGGEVTARWENLVEARVPIQQLIELASTLPPGYRLVNARRGRPDEVFGEGPFEMRSDGYRNNTNDCDDMLVAVIDSSYTNLTQAINNNDAPPAARRTEINYSTVPFDRPGESPHGTGVLETVYDHCPGADYRLYKTATTTDIGLAITDAISNSVDVLVHSASWFNLGWEDDSGSICQAFNQAAENDILSFVSSGNYAEKHWKGDFADNDSDNWHNFAAGDEVIDINVAANAEVYFALSWDTNGGTYDYDLYLYNLGLTTILASSTNSGNTFEEITWTNPGSSTLTVRLLVWRDSGGVTEMEMFMDGAATWETGRAVSASSTTSPSNCTKLNILSIGAVPWLQYFNNSGVGGILAPYSSQGPSNSGMLLPDLSAPTDTTGLTYPTFGGTSCAAPNAAGAAAALWASVPDMASFAIRHLAVKQAGSLKDWGAAGQDNLYGYGGVFLAPYHRDTVWAFRGGVPVDWGYVLNTTGSYQYPYYFLTHAQSAATSGGRVLMLGGDYTESITLDKALRYETIGDPATLGSP